MENYITEEDVIKNKDKRKRNVICIRNQFDDIECTIKLEQYKIFKKLSIKAIILIILFCFVFAFQFKISFDYINPSFFNYNKFIAIFVVCFIIQILIIWIIRIKK